MKDFISLTCIICPTGCSLEIDRNSLQSGDAAEITITGNRCQRGIVYAKEEVSAPKRTVTATCAITSGKHSINRLPVKTTAPCPKEKISALLKDIYKIKIQAPVNCGDLIISDWMGTGINIVSARTVEAY